MGAKHISQAEHDFIAEAFRRMPLTDVVEQVNARFGLNRTLHGMKQWARKNQVKSGRTGQIAKGAPAWNKGKKGVNGKSNTAFRKGNFPHNTLPAFHERIGKDGEIQIKVKERGKTFVSKHRWLWEQKNGPVPKGCIIRFHDGNNRNFSPDNLVCVSRHLNLRLNQSDYKQLPESLRPTRFLVEKLVVATKERARA